LLALALVILCLVVAANSALGLSNSSDGAGAVATNPDALPTTPVGATSAGDSQAAGPLHLSFGSTSGLRIEASAFLRRDGEQRTGAGPSPGLVDPFVLGRLDGAQTSRSGEWGQAGQDEASYYQIGLTQRRLQLRAKFVDAGARFSPSAHAMPQTSADDARMLQSAAGTRNLDVNVAWKLSAGASVTSQFNSLRNDKTGDANRGLSTTDMNHIFALALGPSSSLQAKLNEHSEAWDPALGKTNLQRDTSALEFKTQLGSSSGNDLRMALTTTRTREGNQDRSAVVREIHLNLAPMPRLQLAADSVTRRAEQALGQKTDSVSATMQLAQGAQLAAVVRSLTAGNGSQTRESDVKLNSVIGHGDSSGQLVAEHKTVRAADPNGSKDFTSWDLTGGIGSGPARMSLRAAMIAERALGVARAMTRTSVMHADRAVGRRLKLSADREEKLSVGPSNETAVKSTYSAVAELSQHTKLTAQQEAQRVCGRDQQMMRNVVFEQQARAFRLRSQQQTWREGAAKRASSQYAVDLPRGQIADWAKEITHGHQFPDAKDYASFMPKDPSWLDMPFAGYRVWTKTYRGGPDTGARSVGLTHRAMISQRAHLQVALQKRPEAEDGDLKGRPLRVERKVVEVGTLVGGGLVATTRYTDDASTSGPVAHRQDIGFGLRGPLSAQEQLEAVIAHEITNGADKMGGRTSVMLMYALKASDEHQVSFKGGYAWATDGARDLKTEYRWSLGYSKPI
jgi:hypothetical protein